MSTEQNQMADSNDAKPRVLTGYIYYGENDDLGKMFEVIKDFRVRHGLKFAHYKGYVFFMISSEYIGEFAKVRPFKISKFKSSSEYKCTKEVADKLMEHRNSFIRMEWDESGSVVFKSRTKTFFHNFLVRKVFKESEVEFDKDSHVIHRYIPESKDDEHEGQTKVTSTPTPIATSTPAPETTGFVKVERKRGKKAEEDGESKPKGKYTKKVQKEPEVQEQAQEAPKIRGRRVANKAQAAK